MCESDPAAIRRENEGHEPSIAAAVITDRGRVLLVRRRVPEGDLVWQFPAGKVEHGETVEQAAVREAAEETGVDVTAMLVLGQRVHPSTGLTIHYVACELDHTTDNRARPPSVLEIAEVVWCTRAKLDEPVPSPLHRPVQRYLEVEFDRPKPDVSRSERAWFEVVPVAELPSPSRWQPFKKKSEGCMRWRWPGYRRWRQLRPRRGGWACCWFHGGDWHTVCETAIRHLEQLRLEGVDDLGEQKLQILQRSAADDLTPWEREALDVFMLDEIAVWEVDERERGINPYINGRHRAQAMIDAGVQRALIVRRKITWPAG